MGCTAPAISTPQSSSQIERSAAEFVWNSDRTGAATTAGVPAEPIGSGVVSSSCSVASV